MNFKEGITVLNILKDLEILSQSTILNITMQMLNKIGQMSISEISVFLLVFRSEDSKNAYYANLMS